MAVCHALVLSDVTLHKVLGFRVYGHRPKTCRIGSQEMWQAMEKLVDDGLVRSIGEGATGQMIIFGHIVPQEE